MFSRWRPGPRQIWKSIFAGRIDRALEQTEVCRQAKGAQQQPVSGTPPFAVFIEPSLTDRVGHHYSLAKHYERWLHKNGRSLAIVHAHDHRMDKNGSWHPWFCASQSTPGYRKITSEDELGRVSAYYAAEFRAVLQRFDSSLCLFGTIRFTSILAAAETLTDAMRDKPRRAVFGVLEADDAPDCADQAIVRRAFTQAARVLHDGEIPHRMVVETDRVRAFLLECGFRAENIKTYQYIAAIRLQPEERTDRRTGPAQIGYLGGSRPVRNPDIVAEIISSGQTPDAARWQVQMDMDYIRQSCGGGTVRALARLAQDDVITLHPPGIPAKQYRDILKSLDLIVLPYGDRYRQIGSGMIIEAIQSGIVPIVPRSSSLFELYQSLGPAPPSFESVTAPAIRAAITQALARLDALKSAAEMVRKAWIDHPESVDSWSRDMERWALKT